MRTFILMAFLAFAAAPSSALAADEYTDCNKEASLDHGGDGIAVCTRLIDLRKWKGLELARLYSNRSLAYIKGDNLEPALADADSAIRIAPDYVFAYDNRGEIKRTRKDYDGAIADYNMAIRLDADFLAAYVDRGMTFRAMGNLKSARADFEAVLDMKGKARAVDNWAKKRAQELLDEMGKN